MSATVISAQQPEAKPATINLLDLTDEHLGFVLRFSRDKSAYHFSKHYLGNANYSGDRVVFLSQQNNSGPSENTDLLSRRGNYRTYLFLRVEDGHPQVIRLTSYTDNPFEILDETVTIDFSSNISSNISSNNGSSETGETTSGESSESQKPIYKPLETVPYFTVCIRERNFLNFYKWARYYNLHHQLMSGVTDLPSQQEIEDYYGEQATLFFKFYRDGSRDTIVNVPKFSNDINMTEQEWKGYVYNA